MKIFERVFTFIGVCATASYVFKVGETVGELKGAVKEMKKIRKELHDGIRDLN